MTSQAIVPILVLLLAAWTVAIGFAHLCLAERVEKIEDLIAKAQQLQAQKPRKARR